MAVLGDYMCNKCHNTFYGGHSISERNYCNDCYAIMHKEEVAEVMEEAGCDEKMAEYLLKVQNGRNPKDMLIG